jgi:hypothetical protein
MAIIHQDALNERAKNLAAKSLNGIRLILVELLPAAAPTEARLLVECYNSQHLATIAADPALFATLLRIRGGHRIRGGTATGQIHVTAASVAGNVLTLTVVPIGDYSTYTLVVTHSGFDPLLSEHAFKFRPGCFSNDCSPGWTPAAAPPSPLTIDYLAKDYDSFRHTLITAMQQRVPGWQSTSEADLDQVLIDLFSAAGDELSDYQDRVMAEAYFSTCRSRVSLARHARLMDYHIHQGNQSTTQLALAVDDAVTGTLALPDGTIIDHVFTLPAGFTVWAGDPDVPETSIYFATREDATLHPLFNALGLYTWQDVIPSLAAGATTADLAPSSTDATTCDIVAALITQGIVTELVLQEWLNPATGRAPGANPDKRQRLRLLSAVTVADPMTGMACVRVTWREEDALRYNYCFTVDSPDGDVTAISKFHGNLVAVHQGQPVTTTFRESDAVLAEGEFAYERTERRGILCRLPYKPLAYLATPVGGEIQPQSTLRIDVDIPGLGEVEFIEDISLVHAEESLDEGNFFAVETDELQRSVVRFGNGTNGYLLPADSVIVCAYQVGGGAFGNVGRDAIVFFDTAAAPAITSIWNPFDVTNGLDPELPEQVLRNAPEAYRARQLRAVTLDDYIARAEEVTGVSQAVAAYAWTGSWRTVRISVDPAATDTLDAELVARLSAHLEAVRLIGEDLEIRPPDFVPLQIYVTVCVDENFWPEDIRFILEQEFSTGYTPDGRLGFFHPDNWTFGQSLHASEIAGRIQLVTGIKHINAIELQRWNEPTAGPSDMIQVAFNEIIQVKNDPDHLETGSIRFELQGGRS